MHLFICPICGDSYEVQDYLAGSPIRCRSCFQYSAVPPSTNNKNRNQDRPDKEMQVWAEGLRLKEEELSRRMESLVRKEQEFNKLQEEFYETRQTERLQLAAELEYQKRQQAQLAKRNLELLMALEAFQKAEKIQEHFHEDEEEDDEAEIEAFEDENEDEDPEETEIMDEWADWSDNCTRDDGFA